MRLTLCLLQAQVGSLEYAFLALLEFPAKMGHRLKLVSYYSVDKVIILSHMGSQLTFVIFLDISKLFFFFSKFFFKPQVEIPL